MLCVLPLPALSSTCSSDQLLYSPLGVFVPSLPTVSWMEREQGDLISLSRWLHTMSLPTLPGVQHGKVVIFWSRRRMCNVHTFRASYAITLG